MRTLLLIAVLLGLLPLGSYAKDRACAAKRGHTTHHKTAYHKGTKKAKYKKVARVNIPPAPAPMPVCYGYRQHNIAVAECPGIFYSRDNTSAYEYSVEGTYLGYFPVKQSPPPLPREENRAPEPLIAPQSVNISHNPGGVAPESGNFCTGCTSR